MANDELYLCLLDCSSIQRYVFGSNKLKSNIGASRIVQEKIYADWIAETLQEMFPHEKIAEIKARFEDWKQKPEILQLEKNDKLEWEVGYTGGGNALLFFRAKAGDTEINNYARTFIKLWTRKLLLYAPGLRPATAVVSCKMNELAPAINAAYESELVKNKNAYLAETTLPRHGLTAECKITGLSAEVLDETEEENRWLSSAAYAKIRNAEEVIQASKKDSSLVDPNGDEYVLGHVIEKLGQSEGSENHVAIVHIDGNQIGARFKDCRSLYEKRRLAKQMTAATKTALRRTLQDLLVKMPALKNHLDLSPDPNSNKGILPFRSIIGAGDDVTFVCDARLGLFLAETFIKAFVQQKIEMAFAPAATNDKDELLRREKITAPLSAGAGVAIIRTKYPFYRGYQLAEELCGQAKKKGRDSNTSWLDFHISQRGLSGGVTDIRTQQYRLPASSGQTKGNHDESGDWLLWRPWQITEEKTMHSFNELKNALKYFLLSTAPEAQWPKSKLHQLADALTAGREKTLAFLDMMKARSLQLPEIAGATARASGWQLIKGQWATPYYDILEAMEFYPQCLLE